MSSVINDFGKSHATESTETTQLCWINLATDVAGLLAKTDNTAINVTGLNLINKRGAKNNATNIY